jgi:DNA-binding NarL/FixJ family response regulator
MVSVAGVGRFVGHEGELSVLADLAAGLSDGVGGVLLVEGEQGIGKTALLRAGLAGLRDAGSQVLWGTAEESGQAIPLRLMSECLRGTGVAVAIGHQDGVGGEAPSPLVNLVMAATERVLSGVDRLCSDSPVVLVAEDLQWADDASIGVWRELSRAAGQMPLLLVGSMRSGSGRDDMDRLRQDVLAQDGSLLSLSRLPEPDVVWLVAGLLDGRPGPGLLRVARHAGGNPLYIRELVDSLVRDGRLRVDSGQAELFGDSSMIKVPASLSAVITGRLRGLTQDAVAVLRWAAVLGHQFSVRELEVVAERTAGQLMPIVAAAMAAGVIEEAGARLGFRHGLIRQVLYESMPVAMRSALHVDAARALAQAGARPETVAAQLISGCQPGDGGVPEPIGSWAADWLARHATALTHRAPEAAAALLRKALRELAVTDGRREVLGAALVTACFRLGLDDEVDRVGGELLASMADDRLAARVAWTVGYSLMRTARTADAEAIVARAAARPEIGPEHTARLAALRALITWADARSDQARQLAEVALATAQAAGSRIAAGYARHTLCIFRDDKVAAVEHVTEGLRVIGDDPEASHLAVLFLGNLSSFNGELDRHAEALEAARQAVILAERTGVRSATAPFLLGFELFLTGQWDDALAEFDLAGQWPKPSYLPCVLYGVLALIAGHRDDQVTAEAHLAMAVDPAPGKQLGDVQYSWLAQALIAERAGKTAAAASLLAPCLEKDEPLQRRQHDRYVMLPTLVRLAVATGDASLAVAAAAAAGRDAGTEPLAVKVAMAGHCRGLADSDPAPVIRAAEYFGRSGRLLEHAAALEDAAAILAGRGDLAAARPALARALAGYQQLGAAWDIRRAQGRLAPLGVRRPRSAASPTRPQTGWTALTPTEVRVARLIAEGQSNTDIATSLFISRNTVQTHVSHILAKLGVRSRAAIARHALHAAAVS